MTNNNTITISELVQLRKTKQEELKILRARTKIITKEIREMNKKIQANLDDVIINGGNPQISKDNFGYDYKIKEQLYEDQYGDLESELKVLKQG